MEPSASGSGMPLATGKATRWLSTPRISSTGPTTSGRAPGRGTSETLHLVERFRRTDADTIEYSIKVEDPATFSTPWTAVIPISKLPDDTQIYEYACHEGNYAMPNLLSGGRADAKKK